MAVNAGLGGTKYGDGMGVMGEGIAPREDKGASNWLAKVSIGRGKKLSA